MRGGLVDLPGTADLGRAYEALLHGRPERPDEAQLALYAQWARFDPRLAEIWVRFVGERWKSLNPVALNEALAAQPWPAAGAVLLEFAVRAAAAEEGRERPALWKKLATGGIAPAPLEQYFIGSRLPGGTAMLEDARFPLREYRRWGYLSREILFNKQRLPSGAPGPRAAAGTHALEPEVRREVLRALLERSPRLSTRQYWEALGRSVSLRQAERDLAASPLVKAEGGTRGRRFVRRAGARTRP
jgi:hypothetical protein